MNSPIVIDPLGYDGWDSLLKDHQNSQNCFFHGTAWARVLNETYGHRPFYFCLFSENKLIALLPVMEVSSPLTGRRGVSLPFSDSCPWLGSKGQFEKQLLNAATESGKTRRWKYLECRSALHCIPDATPSLTFYGHTIDLNQPAASLFENCESSVQRGIRKAEKAGLKIDFSNTLEAVRTFYSLHCGTRQRHGLPPQPFSFFNNIARHVLAAGQGFVAIARFDGKPIASAVFFHQGQHALYKFGASDFAFQHLRPNNFLMWESIKHVASCGFHELHLGRTSFTNEGLRRFKLGFGAREEKLSYSKYDFAKQSYVTDIDRAESWANGLFRCLPLPLLRMTGNILYPHLS